MRFVSSKIQSVYPNRKRIEKEGILTSFLTSENGSQPEGLASMTFWALSLVIPSKQRRRGRGLMKRLVPPAAILYHEPPAEDRPYCILGTDPTIALARTIISLFLGDLLCPATRKRKGIFNKGKPSRLKPRLLDKVFRDWFDLLLHLTTS